MIAGPQFHFSSGAIPMRILALLIVSVAATPLLGADAKPVAVPYKLTETKHLLVRVKINGKGPFHFIIDTGAPALFISKEVAKKAGLLADSDGWSSFDSFELEGGLKVTKIQGKVDDLFQLKGMNGMGLAGVELHGVIGYNVLAKYRIQYDFTSDKLEFTALDFDPPPPPAMGRTAKQPGGLEAIGDVMKLLGPLMGMKGPPERQPRGFFGVELKQSDTGVTVARVLEGSPASKAGIQAGDRLVKLKHEKIDLVSDLTRAIGKRTAGATLILLIDRAGKEQSIELELGKGL